MAIDSLVAICGPSCTNCDAYKATRSSDPADLERLAAQWTQFMGKVYTAQDLLCDGCRVGGRLSAYCATCDIRLCAEGKQHDTCAHCSDCPCDKIRAPQAQEALAALRKEIGA